MFIRWLRCGLGMSWVGLCVEAYRYGMIASVPESFDDRWLTGKSLCNHAARLFGEDPGGRRWNGNGNESLPWPADLLDNVAMLAELWDPLSDCDR
jgi:hypothetical protein